MNTQDVQATQPPPAWARSVQATVPAEAAAAVRPSGSARSDVLGGDVGVVMPQADSPARMHGPPIYDEVESRWPRGGREAPSSASGSASSGPSASRAGPAPADRLCGLSRRPRYAARRAEPLWPPEPPKLGRARRRDQSRRPGRVLTAPNGGWLPAACTVLALRAWRACASFSTRCGYHPLELACYMVEVEPAQRHRS